MIQLTLREARRIAELTQDQLASLSGVDQTTISGIEIGNIVNPTNSTVVRLERALALERGSLKFESDPQKQTRLPLKRKAS